MVFGFKKRNENESAGAIARKLYQAMEYYPGTPCFLSKDEFVKQLSGFLVGDLKSCCLQAFESLHHPDDQREFVEFLLVLSYSSVPSGVFLSSTERFFVCEVLLGYYYISCINDFHPALWKPVLVGFAHACLGCGPMVFGSRVYDYAHDEQVSFIESHSLPIAALVNRP